MSGIIVLFQGFLCARFIGLTKMRILVIGASGFVGGYLFNHYASEEVHGTHSGKASEGTFPLDITSGKDVKAMFEKMRPELVFLPAAYSDVNGCQANPDLSFNVNVKGTRNVADMCTNAKLVFFSSGYVFDGKGSPYAESDKTNPVNVYGKHKLEAERIVGCLQNSLIIRTLGVYGYGHKSKNFVMSLAKDLEQGLPRQIPEDQFDQPTYVEDLVTATEKLLRAGKTGVYHVVGPESLSRYAFALEIAKAFGLDGSLITPVKSTDTNRAPRPLTCDLKTDKLMQEINFRPVNILEGLLATKAKMNGV